MREREKESEEVHGSRVPADDHRFVCLYQSSNRLAVVIVIVFVCVCVWFGDKLAEKNVSRILGTW